MASQMENPERETCYVVKAYVEPFGFIRFRCYDTNGRETGGFKTHTAKEAHDFMQTRGYEFISLERLTQLKDFYA